MHETFVPRDFKAGSLAIISKANEIITEYQGQGFTLTLRQLYYQFVSRDLLENRQQEYKRLGSIINDARLAGMIDWDAIEDRTRNLKTVPSWGSPEAIIAAVAEQYQEDRWSGQEYRPEVWIEKDALIGVIEPVCERYRVPYFACRGYTSQSEQYAAGKRFRSAQRRGLTPIVLHLGDHDPSGLDMTRDNADRLAMFARDNVEVRRLALNWPQIEEFDPPPNPAKETDSRSGPYIDQFGPSSWELDALEPTVIDGLIEFELESLLDRAQWEATAETEDRNRELLQAVSDRWDDVVEFFGGEDGGDHA